MSGRGEVHLRREGPVAHVTFDRPEARNAMTWEMYEALHRICEELAADAGLRAVVLCGAGGKAFIAGTDIGQFRDFASGSDGLAYERGMDAHIDALLAIPVPVLAVVEGWAVGGGLNIAAACDLRIATPDARFGVPIARTVGNCLSMATYARLLAGFGEARAKRMLLLGEMLGAEEAREAGFLLSLAEPDQLDAEIARVTDRLVANAPLTLWASKEAMRRLGAGRTDGDDIISRVYGSDDFRTGVAAFMSKETPGWTGQ